MSYGHYINWQLWLLTVYQSFLPQLKGTLCWFYFKIFASTKITINSNQWFYSGVSKLVFLSRNYTQKVNCGHTLYNNKNWRINFLEEILSVCAEKFRKRSDFFIIVVTHLYKSQIPFVVRCNIEKELRQFLLLLLLFWNSNIVKFLKFSSKV